MSRKRKRPDAAAVGSAKRPRQQSRDAREPATAQDGSNVQHPTLSACYPRLLSLRAYLLYKLPGSSKARRRRLATLDRRKGAGNEVSQDGVASSEAELELAQLLDSTLVGLCERSAGQIEPRPEDLLHFSPQHQSTGATRSGLDVDLYSQSEIVDCAIWFLFHKLHPVAWEPPHLLCRGYQRCKEGHGPASAVTGLQSFYPNEHVNRLKGPMWEAVLRLLGKDGERVMLDLLVNEALFLAVPSGFGNYLQMSGTPLPDRKRQLGLNSASPQKKDTIDTVGVDHASEGTRQRGASDQVIQSENSQRKARSQDLHTPAAIVLVRNRMFYARAALNAKGQVRFGLRHIHVFNRFPDFRDPEHTVHVMMYILPRQFGLHNVFTSAVNRTETVQRFMDYTMREHEIRVQKLRLNESQKAGPNKIPKRLRGQIFELVRSMQRRHAHCAYVELLKHYCHEGGVAQENPSFLSLTTPSASVSAFIRAVMSRVVPDDFWGEGETRDWNKHLFLRKVDQFITQRRFESLSMHEILQGFKIHGVAWLVPPAQRRQSKMAKPEFETRLQIFSEFIYYLFDSFLVPLVRSNFYVTESSQHRNRMFFFRHDTWRSLAEPALSSLRQNMFQDLREDRVKRLLASRQLSYSQVRLLPKEHGVRPIINLRRRMATVRNGKPVLGRSINSVLSPVHEMLKYHKTLRPEQFGSALFSMGDIYPKLKQFKDRLYAQGQAARPFFFVKVDVQSCFDMIPQGRAISLVEALVSEDAYRIGRHAEIRPADGPRQGNAVQGPSKPLQRFLNSARAPMDFSSFEDKVEGRLATGRKNTVFVDGVVQKLHTQEALLDLLKEHLGCNLVKVGKRIYRQRVGIPQGSVLSSLLCNLVYGDFEQVRLGFLDPTESLLLRMIDDFLLITLNRNHAERFAHIMHQGDADYGITVKPNKSLANFCVQTAKGQVPELIDDQQFPFCGTLINTKTMEISKDRANRKGAAIGDSLTVEFSKLPGHTFHRKALAAFKIQTHAMFLDTNFNSINTVLANIYQNFVESAMKVHCYARCLAPPKQPTSTMLIRTVEDMVSLAFNLLKHQSRSGKFPGFDCAITKTQVRWLAVTAFHLVLCRKQSKYRVVLGWLEQSVAASQPKASIDRVRLHQAVRVGQRGFREYRL